MRLERGETFPASGTPARIAFSPRLSPSFSQSARNAMREKSVPYEWACGNILFGTSLEK